MAKLAMDSARIRKQVKRAQNKAKFVGILYLFASIMLLAVTALIPLMEGGEVSLTLKTFYTPIKVLFDGGVEGLKSVTFDKARYALSALFYALMLVGMLVNLVRSFAKLGWLFKVRASRVNGVNRNMYAMDDMAKRFSGSFSAVVIFNLIIYILCGNNVYKITNYGYGILVGCFIIHILLGVMGGKTSVFTVGDKVEEIQRDSGLFVFFLRNLMQFVAIMAILYFLLPQSQVLADVERLFDALIVQRAGLDALDLSSFTAGAVEGLVWIFVFVLIKHATAETEFNREGMMGSGILNFRIFSFFVFLGTGALIVFSYLGFCMPQGLNTDYVIVAGVALVAFLLDCILRPRIGRATDAVEEYFKSDNYNWYNNTII